MIGSYHSHNCSEMPKRAVLLLLLLFGTSLPAKSEPLNLIANFRLFGEVNRFGFGWGDMALHVGINGPVREVGTLGFEATGASFATGVLEGLTLPPYGFAVVDREFSVPFSMDPDTESSIYVGLGDDGLGGPWSGDVQVIFDFSDNMFFVDSILENARDQGLALTSVTLEDGTPLEDAGLRFEISPDSTRLIAGASAADNGYIAGETSSVIAATADCGRAFVILPKATASAKLEGGFDFCGTGVATEALVDLDVLPEPDPHVFDLAFAVVIGQTKLTTISSNGPPTANAGADQAVYEGDLVMLDGSASSDADNDPLIYQWNPIAGPAVALDLSHPVNPTFIAPQIPTGGATITIELIVSDGELSSDPDLVEITVKDVNNPPIADAGDDKVLTEGASTSLDGSGSYDPDGDTLAYSWVQTAGPIVSLSDPATESPSFITPLVGTLGEMLTFSLTVSDGIDIGTDGVNVLVENINHSPTADAGPDQTVNEQNLVVLDGSGSSDPDGDPLSFQWNQIGGPPVSVDLADATRPAFLAPQVQAGGTLITFELVVDDGQLNSGPDAVDITVLDTNDPPACDLARAVPDVIWPPNHRFVPQGIAGVTDPDDEDVGIIVTSVTQDEPVNALGDGDTSPDSVVQDGSVLLRAERSGIGNGRVYQVNFMATDGDGGVCTGAVTVCVPHDRRDAGCVDDGQLFDSQQP